MGQARHKFGTAHPFNAQPTRPVSGRNAVHYRHLLPALKPKRVVWAHPVLCDALSRLQVLQDVGAS